MLSLEDPPLSREHKNCPYCSAGNNFSLFAGHMSFQIFLLVGHSTNWTGHNLLTDNTLKKRTQDVLVRCSVIVSDHYVKLAGHFQNLVGQCPMSDCYFQHCIGTGCSSMWEGVNAERGLIAIHLHTQGLILGSVCSHYCQMGEF